MTLTETLADFACRLGADGIPPAVAADATHRVLDSMGIAVAATRSDFAGAVCAVADAQGGTPESTVLGTGARLPAALAAFVNGALVSGDDFDDMHSVAMVHISSVTVPVLLAVAERVRPTGPEALAALVAGAEIGLRIGAAAPHRFILRGLHGTGVCGPFASAAVAARLLGLDAATTVAALGIAGSQSAGLMQSVVDGTWVKRVHAGWAAQSGITAALLAQRGFSGPPEVLEGTAGLYRAFLGDEAAEVDLESVTAGLGESWLLPATGYKRYPSGAWTHAPMDAVAQLMQRHGVAASDVVRVRCALPAQALPVVCEPREEKVHPSTPYQAKFSLPVSVALRAVLGHAGLDDYSEATIHDPRVLAFAQRVECVAEPDLAADGFPARVSLLTGSGAWLDAGTVFQRGGPRSPMDPGEHDDKFHANADPVLGAGRAGDLAGWVRELWAEPRWDRLRALVSA